MQRFEKILFGGVDAVTEIPDDRWSKALFLHPDQGQQGKSYTFAAGVIDDIYGFDPGFFGISPREAVHIDPQQRLLLELAHEAIEDAGLDGSRLAGTGVGVFVGGSSWDHLNLHVGDPSATDAYSMTGSTLCSLSNRISYVFDLRGPSLTVDTACSSSLVALHLACEALRQGQVPAALVGGVNLLLAPHSYVGFSRASMLSRRARCHAFDARADGYVRAEGGGVVVLKPLRAALAAGDPIRAVVRATGVNSDGRTTGFSLPNRQAQADLLRDTYARFGIAADELDYMEAHGTGTPAGDPIEAAALGEVLGKARTTRLPIGSVKTNIGHLEAGSGMAGLLKAMLVLQNRAIPASLHCETPNPAISFEALNLELVPRARKLRANGHLPAVGINSFGFGGTNAHAVLGTAPLPPSVGRTVPSGRARSTLLPPLLLSARSPETLRALATTWAERLMAAEPAAAASMLRAAARRREHHPLRLAALGDTPATLQSALRTHLDGANGAPVVTGTAISGDLAFVFSGNGSQWVGMGLDALRNPGFRSGLAKVDAALRPRLGWSVQTRLADPDLTLRDTAVAQPLLFAVQVATVEALRAAGLRPAACMGHSVGEVAAAWAAGALTLDQAAEVIAARSRHQQATHGTGAMAVLALAPDMAETVLANFAVEIAAENASASVTIAGSEAAMAALADEAARQGWGLTRLDLAYGFHSAAMDPIRTPLRADLSDLTPMPTQIGFVSTVTGTTLDGSDLGADYWWDNVRRPVRFADAARHMVANGVRLFLEIGPQPVLQAYLQDALRVAGTTGAVLSALSRRRAVADPIAMAALRCHVSGHDISRTPAFDGPMADQLPNYVWQRETYRLRPTDEATDRIAPALDHGLLGFRLSEAPEEWLAHLGMATLPWLGDHVVGGTTVLPAAAIIDALLAAARARYPKASGLEVTDLEISRAVAFEPGQMRALRTRAQESGVTLESRTRLSGENWTTHASARLGPAATEAPVRGWQWEDTDPIATVSDEALYTLAARRGLEYGPAFRGVAGVSVLSPTHARVRLQPVAPAIRLEHGLIDPAALDGAFQGLLALADRRDGASARHAMLPWRFGRVRKLASGTPTEAWVRISQAGPRAVSADLLLRTADGTAVMELLECWFVAVELAASDSAERNLHVTWTQSADPAAPPIDPGLVRRALDAIEPGDDELAAALASSYVAARVDAALAAVPPEATADNSAALREALDAWQPKEDLELPPADVLLRSLLFDVPGCGADAALLAAAGATLEAVLRDGQSCPLPHPALLDQFLYHSPAGRRGIAALADAMAAVAKAWPDGRPLRILEVGAGKGTASRALARRLATARPGARYVAMTSEALRPSVTEALAGLDEADAEIWRPLRDGGDTQDRGCFDLVLSLHGLTRGEFGPAELADLRERLAPGGLLLAVEPLPNPVWTLIGVPGEAEAPVQPRAVEDWAEMLTIAGFATSIGPVFDSNWPAAVLAAHRHAMPVERIATASLVLAADAQEMWAGPVADALRSRGIHVTESAIGAVVPGSHPDALVVFVPDRANPAESLGRIAGWISGLAAGGGALTLIVRGCGTGDPVAASLGGLRRVLANEAPGVRCRLIRVDPRLGVAAATVRLASELLWPDTEDDVALDGHGRKVARVRRGLPQHRTVADAVTLGIGRPGLLATLRWQAAPPRTAPVGGEVAIAVQAAGLNFRDVMWAMGLLPDEALLRGFAGPTLGLECAGTVTAIGPGVTDLAVGDRVMAFAPASFGSQVVTRRHAVARLPDALDFAAGATIPVAFFTAVYALGELARLEPGERVLIHGGAGGVGLAAIQYARHRGAEIIVTAGSDAKRALLRGLGVEHVLDSRDLSFADAIMSLTDGEGVDVVLNSLSGEAMERSLGLLRPFGRFLELGKRDFYRNTPVGIRPLRHNATYFAIDADQLPKSRPALAARLMTEIAELLHSGALRPLPSRCFGFNEAVEAFRLMQSASHIGKIVLTAEPVAVAPTAPAFNLRPDATYLVTGGLEGFGLETARWLARRGARHLALLSRRGPGTPGADSVLAGFEADGVNARAIACDVSDPAAVETALATLRRTMPPLAGVFHAAMVMDDGFLPALTTARFARVLAPKWDGAAALDRLTRDDPIDIFVLFSSITTLLGNPGQANYVAANAALEAIAERRHAAGLPALAVGWGPIADVGTLARSQQVSEALARRLGSGHLRAASALDALPAMLAAGVPVVHHADLSSARGHQLPLLASPLFERLSMGQAENTETNSGDLRALIEGRTPPQARLAVAQALAMEVAAIMQLPPAQLDVTRPLADFGMDSLMAVELRTAVEARFGVNLPLFSLSEGVTLAGIAARLVDPLLGQDDGPAAAPDALAVALTRYETAPTAPPHHVAEQPLAEAMR